MEHLLTGTVALVASVILASWLARTIYNIYFHPLAGFAGPWWVGGSYLAEFYYDVVQGGLYFKKIEELHETYGPLIRVNPDELHLNDPYFYEQLYSGSGKRNKDAKQAVMAGMPTSVGTTVDHEHHRQRRGYIASFFSKRSITELEPVIQAKIDRLVEKLQEAHNNGETLVGLQVFGALTTDVISQYAYGESFDELEKPGFTCPLQRDVKALLMGCHYRRFFPTVFQVLQQLPEQVLTLLNPAVSTFMDFERTVSKFANKALETRTSDSMAGKNKTLLDALTDPSIPTSERTFERLKDEQQLIMSAGLETTARFLTAMVCYMLTFPGVLQKLRSELSSLHNPSPTWSQLEALPYLKAFITESLRYQACVASRFPRVPLEPLVYKDWVIPPGTPVGATPWLLNRHPDVFPEPDVFRPERWLESDARGERLIQYLVIYSKGPRICLGINLAYAELYMTIAALIQNFNIELVDSSIDNIIPAREFTLAFDKDYNFGVNFRIMEILL